MRKIKTWRDPYDTGTNLFRLREIEIHLGLTVLVGCNGAGKSTLLQNIKSELVKEKIPVVMFDNLKDGGSNGASNAMFNNDIAMFANMWTSSEGENISNNFSMWLQGVHNFIVDGKYKSGRKFENFRDCFRDQDEVKKENELLRENKERWILLDATDSGLSIDNVIEFKEVFNLIIEDGKSFDKEIYIVISANEFELVRGEPCFDVNVCKYLSFKDYEDYRKFIIKSAKKKAKRLERMR